MFCYVIKYKNNFVAKSTYYFDIITCYAKANSFVLWQNCYIDIYEYDEINHSWILRHQNFR